MQIRAATPTDHDAAFQLWETVGFPTVAEHEWYSIVSNPATFALVAETDGRLVGAVIASFDGWRAFIYHVAVDPEVRGQGIAKALMSEAETLVSAAGARNIYAMVQDEKPAGLALATVMGYEPDGELVLVKPLVDEAIVAG